MLKEPTLISKEFLLKGRIFNLERHKLLFPNKYEIELEIIRHPGASAVVPMLDPETLLLVRQYRHAVGKYIYEIPAGTLKGGEDPDTCAKRELEEETGYLSHDLTQLGMIYPLPGYSDERIYIYLARDLEEGSQHLDEDEVLRPIRVSKERAFQMIHEGLIRDAKSICGLFMADAFLRGNDGR